MNVHLLCFTKENSVIGLSSDEELYSTILSLLVTYTSKSSTDFETTEQMIDYLEEHGINTTRFKLDISNLLNEEE